MDYIQKIPIIISLTMAVIVGMINMKKGSVSQDIYLSMSGALIVFYVIGLLVKNSLMGVIEEVNKKEEEIQNENRRIEEQRLADEATDETKEESGEKQVGAANVDEEFTSLEDIVK